MDAGRRKWLKHGGGATLLTLLGATGWCGPNHAIAESWNRDAFEAHSLDETVKALGWALPVQSNAIVFFEAPEIAENGAVVPIGVTSNVPNTESIAILIEKNPNMLAAVFDIPPGTEASLSTRIKMAETSNVYALVKADGRFHYTTKEIRVVLGGCGD